MPTKIKLRDFAHLVAFKARIFEPDEVMLLGIERALIEVLYAHGAISGEEHEAAAAEAREAVRRAAAKDAIPDWPIVWSRANEVRVPVRYEDLIGDDDNLALTSCRHAYQLLRHHFVVGLWRLGDRRQIKIDRHGDDTSDQT